MLKINSSQKSWSRIRSASMSAETSISSTLPASPCKCVDRRAWRLTEQLSQLLKAQQAESLVMVIASVAASIGLSLIDKARAVSVLPVTGSRAVCATFTNQIEALRYLNISREKAVRAEAVVGILLRP